MVSLSRWDPNQLFTYYLEVHIYIGFHTLKVKCTQYGICSQLTFKNARAKFFLKLGGLDINFRSGEGFRVIYLTVCLPLFLLGSLAWPSPQETSSECCWIFHPTAKSLPLPFQDLHSSCDLHEEIFLNPLYIAYPSHPLWQRGNDGRPPLNLDVFLGLSSFTSISSWWRSLFKYDAYIEKVNELKSEQQLHIIYYFKNY